MMQRHERLDAVRDAGIDELVVVVDAFLVHLALALRQDARPRERDTDALDAELLAEREILGIFMIEIARGIRCEAAPRARHILIPRARAAAVLARRALDLVGRRRATEDKILRKRFLFRAHFPAFFLRILRNRLSISESSIAVIR